MIRAETRNGVCLAHVDGDMTIYTALVCRALLLQHLQSCAALDIDLSRVSEIDSAGLQLLIQARRHGASLGKPVRLLNCSAAVLEMRNLFRLGAEWGSHDERDGRDGASATGVIG
jgi:anti-sigma B factor antagonist